MKKIEIEVKINVARREMEYWQRILRDKSCEDCQHFQQRGCTLANGLQPPLEVVKTGCPEWNWDEIPF